jgi:predicted PurR-regulated permease PerM
MGEGGAARRAMGVLVAVAVVLMAAVLAPLWRPLLVAALLVGVLEPLYERLLPRVGGRRSLLAVAFTLATVVVLLLPLAAIVVVAAREVASAAATVRAVVASGGLEGLIAKLPQPLAAWLRRIQQMLPDRIDEAREQITAGGRWALSTLSSTVGIVATFTFELAMMLIAFFFLLRDGRRVVTWLTRATPLPAGRVRQLLRELQTVARSVLGANLVTGAVQAVVATTGFLIARAPSPILFGLASLLASMIPSVGTALVTLPVAGLLVLLGRPWAGLFLALWAVLVVGLIDNLLRPLLIRGPSRLHGALVFFSLVGATAMFGAAGLLLGPLVLTLFLAVVRMVRAPEAGSALADGEA